MVDFVIPIYRTSKRVQEQFRDIHQRARDNAQPNQNGYDPTSVNNNGYHNTKATAKDYIDFEEVKD
jgi:hypothetical protein